MPVEVVLIGAAELEQVITFQHGNIIAEHMIFSIPKTGTGLLRVYVIGAEILSFGLASLDFEGSAQAGAQRAILNHVSLAVPGPPVSQKAIVNIVGGVVGNVGGQTGNQIPGFHRITGSGRRSA